MQSTILISKLTPILILVLIFNLFSCDTLKPVLGQKEYGGQIKGQIIINKSDLDYINKTEADVINHLKQNLRAVELKANLQNELPMITYYFLRGGGTTIPIEPKISVSSLSNDEKLVINYSIGRVSDQAIIQNPNQPTYLNLLRPYWVSVPIKWEAGNGKWLEFKETAWYKHLNFQVVYLTECDRTYEDFDFFVSRESNPQ